MPTKPLRRIDGTSLFWYGSTTPTDADPGVRTTLIVLTVKRTNFMALKDATVKASEMESRGITVLKTLMAFVTNSGIESLLTEFHIDISL